MTDRRNHRDRVEDHIIEHIEEVVSGCKDEVDKRVDQHAEKLEEMHDCIRKQSDELDELRSTIDEIKEGVNGLLGFLSDGAGALRLLKKLGNGVRWIAGVTLAVGAVTMFFSKMSSKLSAFINNLFGGFAG